MDGISGKFQSLVNLYVLGYVGGENATIPLHSVVSEMKMINC